MKKEQNINQLPKHWKWMKLGKACEVVTGTTPPKSDLSNYGEDVPFFKPPHLWNGMINDTEERLSFKGAEKARVVPPNTVLVTCIGNLGRTGLTKKDAAFNQQLNAIVENENINGKYIFYQAQSPLFKKQLEKLATGTTVSIVNKSNFETIEVPVAPKETQQQIVSKIEELFSEVDKGIEEIESAQQQLKVYRQAVLQWAFEGKLTNKDVKEGEFTKRWRIEKLGSISEMCLGKMLDKQKNKGIQKPYLGNINVRWGEFQLDDLKQMRFENDELERFSLKKGDLVICEGGEPGRCAIWKSDTSSIMIQKALHRVRVFKEVDVRYVYHYLSYSALNGSLSKYFTGTTIKHLTGRELKKIELPMPLLGEQQQIVQEIESRLSVCDKIEETITDSLKQAEALRQSILKKAFEGKLV